jgi:glycerol uptake facilitator protein
MSSTAAKLIPMAAEFVGTALLASTVLFAVSGGIKDCHVPFVVAGVLLVAILLTAQYSSAHLNPAVTAALWSINKIDTIQAILYGIAQLLAAFVVALVARLVFLAKAKRA